jgi:hypothetical protein
VPEGTGTLRAQGFRLDCAVQIGEEEKEVAAYFKPKQLKLALMWVHPPHQSFKAVSNTGFNTQRSEIHMRGC